MSGTVMLCSLAVLTGLGDIILWILIALRRKCHWLMSSSLEKGITEINCQKQVSVLN